MDFPRIKRLPPYVFNVVTDLMRQARRAGEDIIDLSMGNPDGPTPPHVVDKLCEAARKPTNHRYSVSRGIYKLRVAICDWYEKQLRRRARSRRRGDRHHRLEGGHRPPGARHARARRHRSSARARRTRSTRTRSSSPAATCAPCRSMPGGDFLGAARGGGPHDVAEAEAPHPQLPAQSHDRGRRPRVLQAHRRLRARARVPGRARPRLRRPRASTATSRRRSCRCRARRTSASSSTRCRRATTCRAGASASWSATARSSRALARIKSYLDYGIFQPVQIAATAALNGPQHYVDEIRELYRKRRDVLCDGLARIGWHVPKPKATMFVWAEIPERLQGGGLGRVREAPPARGEGRGVAGHRLRRVRRRVRALRADRERAAHPAGGARHPEGARRRPRPAHPAHAPGRAPGEPRRRAQSASA